MKEKLSPGYRWADCKRFPRLHASPFFRLEPAAGHNARARTCTRTTQKFDLLSLPCSAITAGLKSHLLLLWTRFIGIVMGAHSSTVFFFFFFFFYLIWKCPATNVLCCSSSVQTHTHTTLVPSFVYTDDTQLEMFGGLYSFSGEAAGT